LIAESNDLNMTNACPRNANDFLACISKISPNDEHRLNNELFKS